MKTTNKFNLILGVLMLPSLGFAGTQTNSEGITVRHESNETVLLQDEPNADFASRSTSVNVVDASGYRGEASIDQLTTYNTNGAKGDIEARQALNATVEGACRGGSNDQCGAQIELRQTSTNGVQNASTVTIQGGSVSIQGEVSLGKTGTRGAVVTDLGTYVTQTRSTTGTNTTNISTNTSNIATNTSNIATNTTNIATNVTNIATNTSNIATNTTGIATNKTNIATNTTGIATNVTNISANTSLISANMATVQSLIGINASNIQSLSSSFTSFQQDTNRNFVALSGNMHEGLAEVAAISNAAYASSGWRASVGYGDYKNKSATAVGISYAGEKYKFKFSKSGDASGFGISYDF